VLRVEKWSGPAAQPRRHQAESEVERVIEHARNEKSALRKSGTCRIDCDSPCLREAKGPNHLPAAQAVGPNIAAKRWNDRTDGLRCSAGVVRRADVRATEVPPCLRPSAKRSGRPTLSSARVADQIADSHRGGPCGGGGSNASLHRADVRAYLVTCQTGATSPTRCSVVRSNFFKTDPAGTATPDVFVSCWSGVAVAIVSRAGAFSRANRCATSRVSCCW
jgi:hypothetical protein